MYIGKRSKEGNPPMAVKKSYTEIMKQLPEKYSEFVSVFKESSKNLIFIFLFKRAD